MDQATRRRALFEDLGDGAISAYELAAQYQAEAERCSGAEQKIIARVAQLFESDGDELFYSSR